MPDGKKVAPKNRRAKGTGTVFYDDRRGRWVGRRIVGRNARGGPLYVERSGKTQSAVVKALEQAGPPGPSTTVAAWARRWLDGLSVRPGTMESYRLSVSYAAAVMGGHRVADVTPSQASAFLKGLLADPAKGKVGLAASTVNLVCDHMSAMFAAAESDGLVKRNPFALASRPKAEPKAIRPFTADELKRVIADVSPMSAGPLLVLLATTGMRLGEASALDVGDYDQAAGTVAVSKTWSKRFGVGPPKSKHGRRTITVPEAGRVAIRAAIGNRKAGPMFLTGKGRRPIKSLIQRAFKRCLARLKLPVRNVHQLRHTTATLLISGGTPIGDVAKYLGDSVAVVVKTYLHASGIDPGKDMDRILA